MIAFPAGMQVMVATQPIDFRKGADGLMALVRERLAQDPCCGTIFVFRSKRADRIKILGGTARAWCCCGSGWSKGRFDGRQSLTA